MATKRHLTRGAVMAAAVALLVTTGPAALAQTTTTVANTDSDLSRGRVTVAGLALGLGLVLVIAVLVFLRKDRAGMAAIAGDLGGRGVAVTVKSDDARGFDAKSEPFAIEGKIPIEAGTAAQFTAVKGTDPVAVTWSTSAADVSGPVSGPGSSVSVTALKPGQFMLMATDETDKKEAKPLLVPVTAARSTGSGGVQLSVLGAGWGAVVVALTLASITAALGIIRVITGETVGVIIGALVGYAVAERSSGGGGAGSGGAGSGGAGSGGAG